MITYTSRKTTDNARVAQLVERDLAKVEAAGSSPVSRSCKKGKDTRRGILLFLQRALESRRDDLSGAPKVRVTIPC